MPGSDVYCLPSLLGFPTDTNATLSPDVSKNVVSCMSSRDLFAGSKDSPEIEQGFDSEKRVIRRHVAGKSRGIVQEFLSFPGGVCDGSTLRRRYPERITYSHQQRMRGQRDFPRARR